MASSPPAVLLFGHSFIRRLRDDLRTQFDPRVEDAFKLSKDAIIHLHGVGGRTVRKLIQPPPLVLSKVFISSLF